MTDLAIKVNNLSKVYKLYDNPVDRLKESLHPYRKKYHRDFYALKGINFEIHKGETLGIIGKNGSGKSTLLKILTGVLTPTAGEVMVNGKVSALLELGAAFNLELTGIENVYLNGTLMGFSREDIDARLSQILAFADIGDFVYQPVKSFSSGMFVRLAFAAQILVDPDVFIVDEALSVGDVFFQQKCYAKIRESISRGTTCLFVSHDTSAIMNLCTKAIFLNDGAVDFIGSPEEAVTRYYAKIGSKLTGFVDNNHSIEEDHEGDEITISPEEIESHTILKHDIKRHGAGGLLIRAARIVNEKKIDTFRVPILKPLYFYVLLEAVEDIQQPGVGIHIYDRLGNLVFATGSPHSKKKLPPLRAGESLVTVMKINFTVQPGEYTFNLQTAEPSFEGPNVGYIHDTVEMLGPISVYADLNTMLPFYGIAKLPMEISAGKPIRKTRNGTIITRPEATKVW